MPPPANADELLELVQRSGVADEAKLRSCLQKMSGTGGVPAEPQRLAGVLVKDGILTYFQAEQLLQGKYKRFTIGKYKVLEKLGAGGMAQVFLCEHKMMRRRVAIKVLPTAKADDPSSLERFYREARAVAAVDHPNIVRAYDIDQDENLHFLVMEYVDGTNLQDLVKKFGQLDMLRACHYIYASAVGLQHAHEMGLIHRDVKPGNILLDRTGVVKILDMGLARFFYDEEDNVTKKYDENVLGTADYLAPEQALDSHTVDIRADIYSLGATFYFLLTGSAVFPEGSVAQKLIWHQNRQPKSIKTFRADVPDEVIAIVDKMMAKKVENRFQTPADVMAALSPWVATPIPPPAEREMPQVSAAARGDSRVGPTTSAISTAAMTLPRPSHQSVSLPPGLSPVATQPAMSALPAAPRAEPDPQPFADFGDDLNTPTTNNGNTQRPSAGSAVNKRGSRASQSIRVPANKQPKPPPRAGRRPPVPDEPGGSNKVLLGALGLLLLVAAGVGVYFAFFHAGPPPAQSVDGPKKWTVGDGEDPATTVATLGDALNRYQPGDTIVIAKTKLVTGPIRLDAKKHKDMILEGVVRDGKPTVLEAKLPSEAPLLLVNSVEGVRVRNLEFDAGGKTKVAVQVTGSCPGFALESCVVRGATGAGVHFYNAAGADGRFITLDHVRFHIGSGQAGVLLDAATRGENDNRRVTVRGCRFEGQTGGQTGKGVRFDAATTDVEVTGNRFANLESAISFLRPTNRSLKAQVTSNTVYDCRVGLEFDLNNVQPNTFELAVRQNYFAKVQDCGKGNGGGGNIPGTTADTNAYGPDAGGGNVDLKLARVENPQLPTPQNPADDAAFLRFPGGPPEVNGKKVGAP
ncbi:protein kinase domain-containing protein [Gemmata sp.]|uniref:protein kinase domain-containing protein n=1 Tax=Gemmata sp. TaxID=1914242 RepID=UPI003F6FE03C